MGLLLEINQALKMSPQMVQFMNILQMGTLELQKYIENVLLENPTLELEYEQKDESQDKLHHKVEWLINNDRQNHCYYQEDAQNLIELVAAPSGEGLYDHLRSQINTKKLHTCLCIAIECILTSLNDKGYLEETTEELSVRCGQSVKTVRAAENIVQGLEPAGIGARTLSECLALQLERMGQTGLALTLVRYHLEDIAHNRYNQISKVTGASRENIQSACKQIRELNPHPGSLFSPREASIYIAPDILVTEQNGELVISSGDDFLPTLKISSYYQKLMAETDEKEIRDYLVDKLRQSSWVIKSIEQRKTTLLRCAQIIITRQEQFFLQGVSHLQPLTLADVAKDADIHESTVSRAIKDKYIHCIHGTYPISYFFTRAMPTCSGDDVSAENIKSAIRTLIDKEDKKKPFSDQKICDLLTAQGFVLSRRTVAKYRDEIGIPSTAGRKIFET